MSIDLEKVCRTCLSKKGRLRHKFTVKIREMIEFCSSITILERDNLPQNICDNCFRRLINSFAFKNMIQHNDKVLHDLLSNKVEKSKNCHKAEGTSKNHILTSTEPPPLVPIATKMIKPTVTSNNICTICKASFDTRTQLLSHLPNHVPSSIPPSQLSIASKPHKCPICDKRYNHHGSLRLHLYGHTGEKPHQCPICGKRFVRWAGVTSHMVTHSGQRAHVCAVCGRGFKVRSNMERHKILHTGVTPYCCNFCGKTFSQSNNLTLHMQTHHTIERLYLCNICGKQFVSSSRLKRHIQIHKT